MKKLILALLFVTSLYCLPFSPIQPPKTYAAGETPGTVQHHAAGIGLRITGYEGDCGPISQDINTNYASFSIGRCDSEGKLQGLLPQTGYFVAGLYDLQPSSREYIADILNNIGVPTVSRAYAQGVGYTRMAPFLPFWKAFRNLAYSLYIIMFLVVGVMIMLRTKVNAQTIITIQTALPNLLITLLLITFSYAIVGFMIDIMYFVIYFTSYLFDSIGVLDGAKTVDRLMTHTAWEVVFSGRNAIISAVTEALRNILGANSTPGIVTRIALLATPGHGGAIINEIILNAFPYLFAAVWLALSMLKLIWYLSKAYVMLIVQTVTAPMQILMNAMPGSKAFSQWLKKTASYLIPFPVAAAMFIVAAVIIGDTTNKTNFNFLDKRDSNPFGVKQNWGNDPIWAPPFTFDLGWEADDIMLLLGFLIFTMTPASVKMAQDWLQVKESPYTSEAFSGAGMTFGLGKMGYGWKQSLDAAQERKEALDYYKAMRASVQEPKPKGSSG